jgi:hypothetical protein
VAQLQAIISVMTSEADEWNAVRAIEPSLGELIEPLRKVQPQNDPEYPGHTFDFVARRADGTVLAIEVTAAWDQQWIEAMSLMNILADLMTPKAAIAGCAPGNYMIQAIGADSVPTTLRRVRVDDLVQQMVTLPPHTDLETEYGFTVRNWGGTIDRPNVRASVTTTEFMDGGESRARFKRAVEDCTPKLVAAGRDGMRTHLIVVHWALGSSTAFRTAASEMTFGEHPQEVWAVDLGGWPNREPTERLR